MPFVWRMQPQIGSARHIAENCTILAPIVKKHLYSGPNFYMTV